MKQDVKIEIPDAAELLHGDSFKAKLIRFKKKVISNAKYIITIAVAIPFAICVCWYSYTIWNLFF